MPQISELANTLSRVIVFISSPPLPSPVPSPLIQEYPAQKSIVQYHDRIVKLTGSVSPRISLHVLTTPRPSQTWNSKIIKYKYHKAVPEYETFAHISEWNTNITQFPWE